MLFSKDGLMFVLVRNSRKQSNNKLKFKIFHFNNPKMALNE
jgi:hypothetical protein